MKTHYIKSDYRVTFLPDGSCQYDRLLNGKWELFSFLTSDQVHGEFDANLFLTPSQS